MRPDEDGIMIYDPTDPKNVSKAINDMIGVGEQKRQMFARNAKKRAIDNFLVFSHVTNYLKAILEIVPETKTFKS